MTCRVQGKKTSVGSIPAEKDLTTAGVIGNREATILTYLINVHSFPTFNLPYALDVHLSPVTCLQYCSNCPEEFVASLQSVNSELIAENKSTKVYMCMCSSFIFVRRGKTLVFLLSAMAPERWKVGERGAPNVHRPHCHRVSSVLMCCNLAVYH